LRMIFAGADSSPHIAGMDEMPGRINYFPSADPATWHTKITEYWGEPLY